MTVMINDADQAEGVKTEFQKCIAGVYLTSVLNDCECKVQATEYVTEWFGYQR